MVLTRTLRRVLLDRPLPPTFLLPWTANLSTVPQSQETNSAPPPFATAFKKPSVKPHTAPLNDAEAGVHLSRLGALRKRMAAEADRQAHPEPASPPTQPPANAAPLQLSDSLRDLLPLFKSQGPHYITAHIYDRPYLLTQGDTVRLPFFMKGVEPGDVLRLNRASNLGSREYTLKASAPSERVRSTTTSSKIVLNPGTGSPPIDSAVLHADAVHSMLTPPHFIPHIAKGKVSYLDDRLFVCRAVVMGVESEPLRVKEKTKRRNRKIKKIKSKHRYTVIKVKELTVRELEDIDADVDAHVNA